jgi:demethylmenaquinone methyltransferase/2-methoxy-6-polyprenyl-1,4-benzoquinol methylase
LLARAVGSGGQVVGLDLSEEMLDHGRHLIGKACFTGSISFNCGNITALPFADNSFDWVWSSDCLGYLPTEPEPLLRELSRVVAPGGLVAISGWSSEILLPGYPRLEARLRGTSSGLAPFIQGTAPERHFLGALGWFHNIGLTKCQAKTYARSFGAPLEEEIYKALAELLKMRWDPGRHEISTADFAEYRRLCQEDSPDYILNSHGYFGFFTQSLFYGRVP